MPSTRRAPAPLRTLAAALMLSSLPVLAAPPAPLSPHAFQKLVERTRPVVLQVVSEPRGTAVLVGVGGEVLAPLSLAAKGSLQARINGQAVEARLVQRDEQLGLALLALPEAGSEANGAGYLAATVGKPAALQPGDPLVGLAFDRRGKLTSSTGSFAGHRVSADGVGHLRTSAAGPAGTALFNRKGELVGLHLLLRQPGGRRLGSVSIETIRSRLAAAREAPAAGESRP